MADFHQPGPIATLHRFEAERGISLEAELEHYARHRPIALVLPCLFAEFSRPAIGRIIEELRRARYLDTIVVSLGKATREDLDHARRTLGVLPQRVTVIWNDGPAMQALYAGLRDRGLDTGPDGKGRSCWIGYGSVLADRRCAVVASHDCDITTYRRDLVARLCYPVVHPSLGYQFCKGYYARVAAGMNGRVTRLFVAPVLRSLETILGSGIGLIEYLASYRYALAGEFAMTTHLAKAARLPSNWGLEIGMLAEMYRHCPPSRICQAEICANYDHKHQVLSAGNPEAGLLKMAIDIAQMLFRALAGEGVVLGDDRLKALTARYVRLGQDGVDVYEADAALNGLAFDRDAEEQMVEVFAGAIRLAADRHLADPLAVPLLPSWRRVVSAVPDVFDRLQEAVETDSRVTVAA